MRMAASSGCLIAISERDMRFERVLSEFDAIGPGDFDGSLLRALFSASFSA